MKKNFSPARIYIQSWFIKSFGEQIFVGHNLGTSLLENGRSTPVLEALTGGMDIKQAVIDGKNVLLESTYSSLYIYRQAASGKWDFSHLVEGFTDLIKNLEIDHAGNVWAGHMYKGVYRLRLDGDLRKVTEIENYQSLDSAQTRPPRPIKVMKLKGRIVFTDGDLFYTYDDIHGKIVLHDLLNRYLPICRHISHYSRKRYVALVRPQYGVCSGLFQRRCLYPERSHSIQYPQHPPNMGRANMYVADERTTYFCLNGALEDISLRKDPPRKKASCTCLRYSITTEKTTALIILIPGKKPLSLISITTSGFSLCILNIQKTFSG